MFNQKQQTISNSNWSINSYRNGLNLLTDCNGETRKTHNDHVQRVINFRSWKHFMVMG